MTDDNNVFGEFGARSAKFEELLKKYQTIDVDNKFVPETTDKKSPEQSEPAVQEIVQPEPVTQEVVQPEPVAQEIIQPEPVVQEIVQPEPAVQEIVQSEPAVQEIVQPEPAVQEMIQPESAVQEIVQPEPAVQEEPVEEEPDYSYDLDIFGKLETKGTVDLDSFDDSWLDSAFDRTLFYKAVKPGAEEDAEAAIPNPEPATKVATKKVKKSSKKFINVSEQLEVEQTEPQAVVHESHFIEQFPDETEKNAMAGGYIAPTDFADFAFDPDSGMEFDFDDSSVAEQPAAYAQMPEKTRKKKAQPKKESGKNEANFVTGFSKDYKASEGKGSQKEGFLSRNIIPNKNDSTVEKTRKIMLIVCVAVFLFSALFLFGSFVISPLRNTVQMNKLESLIGESNELADKNHLAEEYPEVVFPDGMREKYAELYAENQDFVGWITVDGLDISLPVVRGENNKKYLKTNFNGKSDKYGSIFMNCTNNVEVLDFNTTLFGHYMKNSKMFGNLVEYKTAEGYKKAPVIEFNTIYGDYKWKVFAAFITNGTPEGDGDYMFNYTFTNLSNAEITQNFLNEVYQRTLYTTAVDVAPTDKILTLSTCSYEFDEARLVIMARMVRPGESDAVNTAAVRVNDNPRYPAAYYEENDLSNPWAAAYPWKPE